MQSIDFDESNHAIGSKIEGVGGIPVFLNHRGQATMCFELTEDERNYVYAEGKVWLRFNLNTCMGFPAITKSCIKGRLINKKLLKAAAEQREEREDDE